MKYSLTILTLLLSLNVFSQTLCGITIGQEKPNNPDHVLISEKDQVEYYQFSDTLFSRPGKLEYAVFPLTVEITENGKTRFEQWSYNVSSVDFHFNGIEAKDNQIAMSDFMDIVAEAEKRYKVKFKATKNRGGNLIVACKDDFSLVFSYDNTGAKSTNPEYIRELKFGIQRMLDFIPPTNLDMPYFIPQILPYNPSVCGVTIGKPVKDNSNHLPYDLNRFNPVALLAIKDKNLNGFFFLDRIAGQYADIAYIVSDQEVSGIVCRFHNNNQGHTNHELNAIIKYLRSIYNISFTEQEGYNDSLYLVCSKNDIQYILTADSFKSQSQGKKKFFNLTFSIKDCIDPLRTNRVKYSHRK